MEAQSVEVSGMSALRNLSDTFRIIGSQDLMFLYVVHNANCNGLMRIEP